MPKPLYNAPMDDELRNIILAEDYDQSQLQDWFRKRYGEWWIEAWRRYLETGDISW